VESHASRKREAPPAKQTSARKKGIAYVRGRGYCFCGAAKQVDIPTEVKPDLHRTLLGPLGLANDIFGALLPGCIFTILLLLKGRLATTLLSYSFLGYKTKVVCGLLASYVFGKVSLSVVTLIEELARATINKRAIAKAKKENKGKESTALQLLARLFTEAPDQIRSFVIGIAGGPFMLGKSRAYEYYAAYNADSLFHLSSGLIFIVAAAIPGDGGFRWLEGAIGIILLARGLRSSWTRVSFVAGLMGMMAGDALLQRGLLWRSGSLTDWASLFRQRCRRPQ
jgi:hypothetical protein